MTQVRHTHPHDRAHSHLQLTEMQAGVGMERRAFGEFVGPRGELASYAFGRTTEADPHVARLTVGIGAGNPGSASFHAIVFDNKGDYACSLVDEPFERVPEAALTSSRAKPAHTRICRLSGGWWTSSWNATGARDG